MTSAVDTNYQIIDIKDIEFDKNNLAKIEANGFVVIAAKNKIEVTVNNFIKQIAECFDRNVYVHIPVCKGDLLHYKDFGHNKLISAQLGIIGEIE